MIREKESVRIPLRLLGGKLCAAVELSPDMNEQAWQQMMDMLQALKPGYVAESECSVHGSTS